MIINKDKLDRWEWDLVQKYDIPYPCCDLDAYNQYPKLNWIYDKYRMSKKFNPDVRAELDWEMDDDEMGNFIYKPRVNLWGLGRGTSYYENSGFGIFRQERAVGHHISVDIRDGKVYGYRGRKIPGKFDFFLWHRMTNLRLHDQATPVLSYLSQVPNSNFEMIGDTIIEAHLRPSIQFWSLPNYSLVIHNYMTPTTGKKINWKPKTVHDWFLINDPEDTRVAILNGDNLRDLYNFAMFIFSFDEREEL